MQELTVDIELRNTPVPHNAVVLVGRNQDPIIPKHEWDDFYQHAKYWERKYEATRTGEAYVFEVRDIDDVQFALDYVKDIGNVTTFAHGGERAVYLDEDRGLGTHELTQGTIASLALTNIAPENLIYLYTCYAGAGEVNIAEGFANEFSSPVWATSTGCNYGYPLPWTNIRFFPHTPRNLGFGLDGIYRWFYPAQE